MVERLREKLSNEQVADRIARMLAQLEKAAGGSASDTLDADSVRLMLGHGSDALSDGARRPAPSRQRRVSRPFPPL
jgi:ATP-dependent Lhr-like helicase